MYSIIPIHWNIKSAPASPGRSRVGPALYVFSLLGENIHPMHLVRKPPVRCARYVFFSWIFRAGQLDKVARCSVQAERIFPTTLHQKKAGWTDVPSCCLCTFRSSLLERELYRLWHSDGSLVKFRISSHC
jgi:hypothetical protein